MTLSWRTLLLFTAAACVHNSRPDAADLAPLAAYMTDEPSEQGKQPLSVRFADRFTATVFKSLKRDARYRIDPTATRLACPSKEAEGPQGYVLRVDVTKVMGDTAIVTTRRMCSGPGMITYGENYLLIRRIGRWRLETVISGFTNQSM